MKKILVPVDGSKPAQRACQVAKDLASKYDSDIILVTVVPGNEFVKLEQRYDYLSQKTDTGQEMLSQIKEGLLEAKEEFGDMADRVETRWLKGDVAHEILTCANREGADLIVMGSRGLGAFTRTFLGSVSHKIVNHSDISVLIVK